MILNDLMVRAENICELCGENNNLSAYAVAPKKGNAPDESVLICENCKTAIASGTNADPNYWRCLNSAVWSEYPAVQVLAWRILQGLQDQDWAFELSENMYMDDTTHEWAMEDYKAADTAVIHKDSNGNVLSHGDTVILTKDLDVKGAGFTAKRGTAVRNIVLVEGNPEQIEGRVEGQHIVILTQFVKK